MEDHCSPLSWGYYYQEEGIEELKHCLLYTTLELETTILSAHEEIARKEDELAHLNHLLTKTIKERDEAKVQRQMLLLEEAIFQQKQKQGQLDAAPSSGTTSNGFSSSDSDENIIASPSPPQLIDNLVLKKPLPENGKFLVAVMEAGPLLQTLLLAAPLPQWQHPPPQLNSTEIPPVTIPSPLPRRPPCQDTCISTGRGFSKKRGLVMDCEASDSSPNTK
ncbi:hypothetical protein CsSME_00028154 [Camellia sinensis var. sinensis]